MTMPERVMGEWVETPLEVARRIGLAQMGTEARMLEIARRPVWEMFRLNTDLTVDDGDDGEHTVPHGVLVLRLNRKEAVQALVGPFRREEDYEPGTCVTGGDDMIFRDECLMYDVPDGVLEPAPDMEAKVPQDCFVCNDGMPGTHRSYYSWGVAMEPKCVCDRHASDAGYIPGC
jgi:hypothetical protein